jgi:hypothetical protein
MNANSDREYIDNELGDVRTAVDDMHTSMDERFAAMRTSMDERFAATHTSIDDLRVTMNERFEASRMAMDARFNATDAKIDAAVARGVSEMIKWVVGLFITLIVLTVALASVVMHLFLNQSAAAPAPPAAPGNSTPAVIIQLTPQGVTVLPAAPPAAAPGAKP